MTTGTITTADAVLTSLKQANGDGRSFAELLADVHSARGAAHGNTVRKALSRLRADDAVKVVGAGKRTRYVLTEAPFTKAKRKPGRPKNAQAVVEVNIDGPVSAAAEVKRLAEEAVRFILSDPQDAPEPDSVMTVYPENGVTEYVSLADIVSEPANPQAADTVSTGDVVSRFVDAGLDLIDAYTCERHRADAAEAALAELRAKLAALV